jgi:hypothetical protein
MILWTTIYNRIEDEYDVKNELRFAIDIRYLGSWMQRYPQCFPKFMLNGKYSIFFHPEKLRYEINRLK